MSRFASKYSIELVSPAGVLLSDLTGKAMNRRIVMSRNEAEEISWTVDLNEFEAYCRRINQDPTTVLVSCATEVRIKRGSTYLCGGQLIYYTTHIDAQSQTVEIRADGFLNLFKARYTDVTRSFTATEATTIATTLITETQLLVGGNFGITIGAQATVGPHDRNYKRQNVKDALQDLTELQTSPFDFEFTYNKIFKTYAQIGTVRPDIIFEYPKNIIGVEVANDGTGLANEVFALGSGFGTESGAFYKADNVGSQSTYGLRQKVKVSNGVDNSDNGLTDEANAELAAWAFPVEVPILTINANVAPFVTDYKIGDRVQVQLKNHPLINHVSGYYRIEKIELAIDSEDNETVKLYVSV